MTFISYAQNYEDIMLYRALRDVGEGFYVDVGANSPDEHSVTRAFYERGWRGINIEPVMEFHQQLLAARPRDINLPVAISDKTGFIDFHDVKGTGLSTLSPKIAENHRASGYEVVKRSVAVETLDEVFRKYVSGDVHFLKVDVEGLEDAVLRGVSLADVRPWIIVVEATAVLSEVQTHASWDHLLTDRGYSFVYFDGLNRFYVAKEHPELMPSFRSAPNVFDDWMRVGDRQAHDRANILSAKLLEVQEAHGAELDAARAEIEEWKAKAAALQVGEEERLAREAALEARLSDLRAQLSSFEGRTSDLMGTMEEAVDLRAAIAVMRDEFREWVGIRERAAEREAHLGAQVAAATAEATALRHRIAELEYAASVTKLSLDSMFASTSWRVTAPVRAVKTAVVSSAKAIGAGTAGGKQPEGSLIRRAAHWSARQPMLKRAAVAVLARSPALERKVRAIVAPPPGVQPAAVAHTPQPRQIGNTGPAITSRNPTPAEIIVETAFQRALARALTGRSFMRIVLDMQSRQSPSRVRGIGRYSLALARHVAKLATGHEVIVAVNGALAETVDAVRADFDGLIPPERIVAWSQPGGVGFVNGDSRWRARAAERLRERFLESLRPDIVHVTSLFEGLGDDVSTSIGEVGADMATAVTLYDLIPMVRRDVYLANPVVADWYERKLASLRRADLWLAISDHTRREGIELLGLPEDRVRSISSAVDPMFRPVEPVDEKALRRRYGLDRPFVLYTATIEPHKNVDGLFAAFAKLPPNLRRGHKLAIVCRIDDHNLTRLKAAAKRAGLRDDEYVITGYVPDEDLLELYAICRLFVFPSLHEGFGLPALEAMACGAPVIASNSTSLPEVIGREDALFDPSSPDAIAGAMARVLGDEGMRQDLSRHGLARARLFNWENTARRTLDAFEELHDRRQAERTRTVSVSLPKRPRLAFVGPLKPVAGRFSEHAAAILPELSRHYDIECVVRQDLVEDAFARSNLPVRSAEWFAGNGAHYDRVLYQVGDDSELYSWVPDLLRRWPGTVVLHDSHLGAALSSLPAPQDRPEPWMAELYRSHGWTAVVDRLRTEDPEAVVAKYPCDSSIRDYATGVLMSGDTAGLTPGRIAVSYRDAIEEHAANSRLALLDRLADDVLAIATPDQPGPADWEKVLACAAENLPSAAGTRQLMIDVSELVQRDAGTGIQRVTKNITIKLLEKPPAGFRVEPVFDDGTGVFRYARALTAKLIGYAGPAFQDDLIDTRPGDVLLGLDLVAHQIEGRRDVNRRLRHRGVRIFYVVYDLLPVLRPEWFPPFPLFRTWLQAIASEAEGLVCISRSVAQQFLAYVPELEVSRSSPLKVGHFHLGGDIDTGAGETSDEVTALLRRPTRKFLVVGTVEPRKGHAQCLAAFEELWAAGKEIDLVVVGKQGWMVDDLAERMRNHAEAGKRLHWFAKASDADLNALYEKCTALLAMSQDEGFGLPLIEAAKHGLPIIARDILVFREIAGEHAAYFSGSRGSDFASALSAWIDRHGRGDVPASAGMPWLTWNGSAERLVDVVLHGKWDAAWSPGQAAADLSPADLSEDLIGTSAGDASSGTDDADMTETGRSSRLARRA